MNLDRIQKSELVLVDANIILYSLRSSSEQCTRLLRRCTERDITGFLTTHIVAEVMHRLMIAEARENEWITGSNPAQRLADQPERVQMLSRYEQAIKSLIATGMPVEPVLKEDFIAALRVQREAGLLTNDALLVAVAERLRIEAIASADASFAQVRGVMLYQPDDL